VGGSGLPGKRDLLRDEVQKTPTSVMIVCSTKIKVSGRLSGKTCSRGPIPSLRVLARARVFPGQCGLPAAIEPAGGSWQGEGLRFDSVRGLHKTAGQGLVPRQLTERPSSPDRHLTVVQGVQSWHSAARTNSRWHLFRCAVRAGLNKPGRPLTDTRTVLAVRCAPGRVTAWRDVGQADPEFAPWV
jgi:hypothetical protein